MEFDIDIKTEKCGKVTITDYSIDYNQYIDEDVETIISFDKYKYSHTVTINSILKVSPDTAVLLDVLQDSHDEGLDQGTFTIKEDGYYVIDHYVLPNKLWYDTVGNDYDAHNNYSAIYIADQGKVFKEVEGKLEECTLKEILERNIDGTTLMKCSAQLFYTGHLQECYMGYCRKVFSDLMSKCTPGQYESDVWARDFIYMTLNIIDYLVGFEQYMEAYRILSESTQCGGFCSGERGNHVKNLSGCGCSKA